VIFNHVFAELFEPFRIHTASRRIFEIRHPEFVQVGKTTMTDFAPPEKDPDAPERWEKISYVLIESIAPLPTPVNSGTS
jgi:hypothetical protein